MNRLILLWLAITAASSLHAGIETIYLHEGKVKNVSLRLSNSTVFRFDHKPANVIIGNSNYFQAEFVGNDVSVQPVAEGTTNMFVYSGGKLYTFRLNAYFERPGHDLLIVKFLPKGAKKQKPIRIKQKDLHLLSRSKGLKLSATKLISTENRKIVEFLLEAEAKKKLRLKDISLSFSRGKKKIEPMMFETQRESKSSIRLRVSFPRRVKPFSVAAEHEARTARLVISKGALWVK